MQTVFLAACAIAVLLIGAGVFWAMYQLVYLLKHVRLILLPQVELTLTEVQKNLNNIDALTQDVDNTVEGANQIVASANRTVQSVEQSVEVFNKRIAIPMMIGAASAKEGLKAAWKAYRGQPAAPKGIVVIQEPAAPNAAPEIGILRS